MIINDSTGKFTALAEKLGVSLPGVLRMISDEQEIEWRIVKKWIVKSSSELRNDSTEALREFCQKKIPGFSFDYDAATGSTDALRARLGLQQAHEPHGDQTTPEEARRLVGRYQVIRPHCGAMTSYVLEALEIEEGRSGLKTLFFSHNQPRQQHMYEGVAQASTRYFFSLLSRPHELLPDQQSYRCISFHMGDGKYSQCLSGVMLRGMSGTSAKKEAVGLPFIAIRLPEAGCLRNITPDQIDDPNDWADPLFRLHGRPDLLVGTIEQASYPALFDFCAGIFNNERVSNAVKGRHDLVIYTVQQQDLRYIPQLSATNWCQLISGLTPN